MIEVNRSGEWMPAEDLRSELLALDDNSSGPVLDLAGIDHLDAACLQVILSFQEGRNPAGFVDCRNLSSGLAGWLRFAGALDRLQDSSCGRGEGA